MHSGKDAIQRRICQPPDLLRRHKLRWGWLKNDQCQFVELSRWMNTSGISVIRSVPEVERLRVLLEQSPPDPQLVCANAGETRRLHPLRQPW